MFHSNLNDLTFVDICVLHDQVPLVPSISSAVQQAQEKSELTFLESQAPTLDVHRMNSSPENAKARDNFGPF